MKTSDPRGALIRAELANDHLPTNGIPHWGNPGNGEMAYRCTTCGSSFSPERTFQAGDGRHYCVLHILNEIGRAA
jgi:DNA-directed RNA polymerase subunit RPC12/RpoP